MLDDEDELEHDDIDVIIDVLEVVDDEIELIAEVIDVLLHLVEVDDEVEVVHMEILNEDELELDEYL